MFRLLTLATIFASATALPVLDSGSTSPIVGIKNGTIVGSSFDGVDSFLGIPFAKPPTGTLRLKPPQPIDRSWGTIFATSSPTACPQMIIPPQSSSSGPTAPTPSPQGEDCLTINVQRPSNVTHGKKLPVLFWIFGGGFEIGASQQYNGSVIVQESSGLGQGVVFVAVNYRLNGFGFLAGKELQKDGSTNLGLRDQRAGLRWVAENIEAFGGDPDRVTIFGQSAGSISVFDHLLIQNGDNTYCGKPLFHGAIMASGSTLPALDVVSPKAQAVYDTVVAAGGCSQASNTLDCLRALPFDKFNAAVNVLPTYASYSGLDLSYLPRPDPTDNFYPLSPEVANAKGHFAHVPAIIGDMEDEGTYFAFPTSNVTTTEKLVDYLLTYFPLASRAEVQALVNNYPRDPAAGSPFRTGVANEVYPQFKRIAALFGDIQFNLVRRNALATTTQLAPEVPWWSYLATYGYGTPNLGSFHGLDIEEVFFDYPLPEPGIAMATYIISFVNHLNPNTISTASPLIEWPRWTNSQRQLINISKTTNSLIQDNFREKSYEYLRNHYSTFQM